VAKAAEAAANTIGLDVSLFARLPDFYRQDGFGGKDWNDPRPLTRNRRASA
jgi:hypothetical protein